MHTGMQADQGDRVLDSLGIEHLAFTAGTVRMEAIVRGVYKDPMVRVGAQFKLTFASAGRLTSISARRVYTGP